jgi:hypothetical protein
MYHIVFSVAGNVDQTRITNLIIYVSDTCNLRARYRTSVLVPKVFILLVEITNKLQPCIRIYYSTIH